MVQGRTGQMRLSWSQGVSRRCYLRGEDCQNSVRLRDSPAAAVHMEAEGGGEGMEPQEGVWLMSARLGGNVCARRRRGEQLGVWRLPGPARGPDADENLPDKQKRLPATSSAWSQLCVTLSPGHGGGGVVVQRMCNSSVKTPQPFLSCLSGHSTGSSFKWRSSSAPLSLANSRGDGGSQASPVPSATPTSSFWLRVDVRLIVSRDRRGS